MTNFIGMLTVCLSIVLSMFCGTEMAEGKFFGGFTCWIIGIVCIVLWKMLMINLFL